ncbi:hypothetical protein HanHA300_Chr02g0044561 [Helianthus annuus]|nr:hypothetical protein HanHA300_Chr02g0044561 [Helianthus annuus]KAJ0618000.1 hypothetical protein HanHA89_Chr02g0048171 [Helianthus annuus]
MFENSVLEIVCLLLNENLIDSDILLVQYLMVQTSEPLSAEPVRGMNH